MTFSEDQSRVRTAHAGQNMALLRKIALNALRKETNLKVGVAAKRKMAGWNDDDPLNVLKLM